MQMQSGLLEQVCAPNDVRYAGPRIVDDDREMVGRQPVAAENYEVSLGPGYIVADRALPAVDESNCFPGRANPYGRVGRR